MPGSSDAPEVLILAPLGGDAPALAGEVEAAGLRPRLCASSDELAAVLEGGATEGILFALIAHEGADERAGEALLGALAAEPVWSQLPIVFVVADADRPPPACRMLNGSAKPPPFVLLERPARRAVLQQVFAVMVAVRRRQFEARDLLERLRDSDRRHKFLLSELRHRLGNSLTVLQAMFRLTARESRDLDALVQRFTERLENFADAHAALSREDGGARELETLLRDHVEPYRGVSGTLRLDGPPVRLDSRLAFELALVVHELATNAAKYGAFSAGAGTVEVRWHRDAETGALEIVWTESGGPPVEPPERQGLGSALIRNFTAGGAEASLEFPPEGLVWRVRLPPESFGVGQNPPAGG